MFLIRFVMFRRPISLAMVDAHSFYGYMNERIWK